MHNIFSFNFLHNISCKVNARWLMDLDQFNEWMNEEDYELTQAEIAVSDSMFVLIISVKNHNCYFYVSSRVAVLGQHHFHMVSIVFHLCD